MIIAVMLLSGIRYAHAQNTGANPYFDSEHSYRVSIGDADNEREWVLTNGTDRYTLFDTKNSITTPLTPFDGLVTILATGTGENSAGTGYHGVRINFENLVFNRASDEWILEYYEYLDHGGGYECVAARKFTINLAENTFYLTVSTNEPDEYSDEGIQVFNGQHNKVRSYNDLFEVTDSTTTLTYTVTMTKSDDFDPTYWEFDVVFDNPYQVESLSALVTSVNGGTLSTTTNTSGSNYTIRVTPHASNVSSVELTITVVYAHDMLAEVPHNLRIENGVAVLQKAAPIPDVSTFDNIVDFPADGTGNRTQAITILAVPSTRDITFDNSTNTFETENTASNPLYGSTHYYKVQMGNTANIRLWRLDNSSNITVLEEGSGITPGLTASDALATVNYGTLAAGTYYLYFTETDINTGAIAIRKDTITIQPPFEVVLAETTPQCSGADNVILAGLLETTTTINYTISLPDNNPDPDVESFYTGNWKFDFALTDDPGFGGADLDVSSITTTNATGVSLNGTGTSRLVEVTAGVTSVVIQVVYTGLYTNQHKIKVTLSNITGSFNEATDDVEDTHIIYAMPQAGTLAGVE